MDAWVRRGRSRSGIEGEEGQRVKRKERLEISAWR